MKRFLILFIVVAYSVMGCAGSTKRMKPDFQTYLKWRADDFAEIVDIGFTISRNHILPSTRTNYRSCRSGMPMLMDTSSAGAEVSWEDHALCTFLGPISSWQRGIGLAPAI